MYAKIFVLSMVAVFLVAAAGSLFTADEVKSEWYRSIKPAITPPDFVFPIVWTFLFFLIGLSLYLSWINSKKEKFTVSLVYGAHFVLNILLSVLYFGLKSPLLAFFDIVLMWFSILLMINTAWKINRRAGLLLIPYLAWVTFAALLNFLSI